MKKLNSIESSLAEKHHQLAKTLVSYNIKEDPYNQGRLPSYRFEELRRGIICPKCDSTSTEILHTRCICTNCKYEEKIEAAIVRSVEEFKLLFPKEKITTKLMYDWLNNIPHKRKIQRTLNNHYRKVGVHQWMYYE